MLSAVIVAAGRSRRMGFDKLMAELSGRPVLWHSIRAFLSLGELLRELVLVSSADRSGEMEALLHSAWMESGSSALCRVIAGGAERHLSVWEGLQALSGGGTDFVAVHDGARPLVSEATIRGCWEMARQTGAACCAAPVPDTVKRADANQWVSASVDREGLWAMQTPQIFEISRIVDAYAGLIRRGEAVTDEVSALQEAGGRVALFRNEDWNFKITFPRDLELAEQVLRRRVGPITSESEGFPA